MFSVNITLDCAGFTVQGTGADDDINVAGHVGVTVRTCVVTGFGAGIRLQFGADGNSILDNTTLGNAGSGIVVGEDSEWNVIAGNTSSLNGHDGFGVFSAYFEGNVATNNDKEDWT